MATLVPAAKEVTDTTGAATMAQGFSGGFFLPAQRSVHCKGGFFSSAARAPVPSGSSGSTTGHGVASTRASPQFPVLFTLPQVPPAAHASVADPATHPKARGRRVYDPHEGDEECELRDEADRSHRPLEPENPPTLHRSASTATRFVRGRQQQQPKHQPHKKHDVEESRATRSRSNNASRDVPARARPNASRVQSQAAPPTDKGDINSKFEIAMKELNQIKGEFELKEQRQNSAPVLLATRAPVSIAKSSTAQRARTPPRTMPTTPNQLPEPQDEAARSDEPATRDMQSPRQRLQVAEMVMRKLYKKNLQTEHELATAKAENERLAKRLSELDDGRRVEHTTTARSSLVSPPALSSATGTVACQRCTLSGAVGFVLANPPSMETVSRIDQQQLEYLRHLAAEQDRTITSLKVRIEDLSAQLTAAKQQANVTSKSGSGHTSNGTKSTPRQALNKLQTKLQEALGESERQKNNYLKLKRDFQHLLGLKTKTLYENPTQLNAGAKELVALMNKQLKQLEVEHSMNLSLYNSKLYEREQQSCESYAQQRLLEEEMDRVARDVQQRDALDVEIEQCMTNVFERLHHVESENVHLKTAILTSQNAT